MTETAYQPNAPLPGQPPLVLPTARIDERAPEFEARTTAGLLRMSDFLGKWLVFFSHPADFTPVCTSEFIAFEKAKPEFEKLDCHLLGLAVDSLYAHIAWIRDIDERFGVKISFPIIEDLSMSISRVYGMIHDSSASTAAVRSVFFIDPDGYIRAMIHYPMNVGRSVSEILRVLTALQLTDKEEAATPEGWLPGEAMMLPPPLDLHEADKRAADPDGNWYYCLKERAR